MILHWPFANYYNAWRELEKLYEEGKLRAIGVSNFEPGQLVDLIAYNRIVPAIDQIETNLYCQRAEERKWLEHTWRMLRWGKEIETRCLASLR